MKKTLVAFVGALVFGAAVFAENRSCGIGVSVGVPIGFPRFTDGDFKTKITDIGIDLHLSTYDCFALNNIIGVYASVALGYSEASKMKVEYDGTKLGEEYGGSGFACDLMLGPAFGFDIGSARLQTGVAFHAHLARYSLDENKDIDYNLSAFGLALTPQFKFGAERRLSFIVGCDLMFDFGVKISIGGVDLTDGVDKKFRFGFTPHLGLGINF